MSEYDTSVIRRSDIALLREVHGGRTGWRANIVRLVRRALAINDGLYAVRLTHRGEFALRGIFAETRVAISQDYHIRHMRGVIGTTVAVHDITEDTDGYDEYGFKIRSSSRSSYVVVRLDNEPGEWCFYRSGDLVPDCQEKRELFPNHK